MRQIEWEETTHSDNFDGSQAVTLGLSARTFAEQAERLQILHDVTSLVRDKEKVQLVQGVVHVPAHACCASIAKKPTTKEDHRRAVGSHLQFSVSTYVCCFVPVPTSFGKAATRP